MNRSFYGLATSLALLCIVGCAEDLNPSRHTLDQGDGDPDQWVPTGRAMQALTPRASALLGGACTLMRFEWFYLEEDLAPLSQDETEHAKSSIIERFGQIECGRQRVLYSLLATTPVTDRDAVMARSGAWGAAQEGHYLRPETLLQLQPAARRLAVEVAATCPDFATYLGEHRSPQSLSAVQWQAVAFRLRSPAPQRASAGPETCAQVFSAVACVPIPLN